MSKEKKRKKKKSFLKQYKWDYIFLAIFILSAVVYYADSVIKASRMKQIYTSIVDFGVVESSTTKQMVIIRNDKVLVAPSDGYYELSYPEGERVKTGLPVVRSKNQNASENYTKLIELIDSRIALLGSESRTLQDNEVEKINNRLEYLYRSAQGRIENDEIEYIEIIKKELISLNDRKRYFFSDGSAVSKEELLKQKQQLLTEFDSKNTVVISDMNGLISSYYDGHEKELNILNIRNLTVSQLERIKNVSGIDYSTEKKKGDPVAVISENYRWYLACEVTEEDIDNIASERPIFIEIEDKRFRAYLEDFYKGTDGKFVGYFRVEDDKFNFFEKRKFTAKLIFQSSNGLVLPNSALTDIDGKSGVFVVDMTGIARFVEIKDIVAEDDKNIGVEYDASVQNINQGLRLYDEVIINPSGIVEGQRVR